MRDTPLMHSIKREYSIYYLKLYFTHDQAFFRVVSNILMWIDVSSRNRVFHLHIIFQIPQRAEPLPWTILFSSHSVVILSAGPSPLQMAVGKIQTTERWSWKYENTSIIVFYEEKIFFFHLKVPTTAMSTNGNRAFSYPRGLCWFDSPAEHESCWTFQICFRIILWIVLVSASFCSSFENSFVRGEFLGRGKDTGSFGRTMLGTWNIEAKSFWHVWEH